MFEAGEIIPDKELESRHHRCRELMARIVPDADGLLVFGRLNIYYLSGSLANGAFWLPREGGPVLLVRKSLERAVLESPLKDIRGFRSYADVFSMLSEKNRLRLVAAEKGGLSWAMAENLTARFPDVEFASGDHILARARAVKSEWELTKLRHAGALHHTALSELIPSRIHPGMSERDVSHICWEIFFSQGHGGQMRMSGLGEEAFLGHISAGINGMHPSHYNGPLGLKGEHPAVPFMGNAASVWRQGEILSVDVGFNFEGYNTDKTQVYFAGNAAQTPSKARRAHDLCIEIQQTAAAMLKPGAIPSEIYAHAVSTAAKAGFADSFMGLGENQVPFLGHGIGLTIDEWPVLARRFDDPLEPDMVMAIEPKISIPNIGMVGVEDTYVITQTGGVCLTGGGSNIIGVK